jgi:hypothetical protein
VALVRHGPAPFLAVVDANEKDGTPFRAEALWHTALGNHLEIDGQRFTLAGRSATCAGEVLLPPDARLSAADSHGRPQLRVTVDGTVVETVTVFCPRRPGEPVPRFTCERLGPGAFRIQCAAGGHESTLELAAATRGPLREPLPVRLLSPMP